MAMDWSRMHVNSVWSNHALCMGALGALAHHPVNTVFPSPGASAEKVNIWAAIFSIPYSWDSLPIPLFLCVSVQTESGAPEEVRQHLQSMHEWLMSGGTTVASTSTNCATGGSIIAAAKA